MRRGEAKGVRRGPKLVAIVGGSGAGKSWLADRLETIFAGQAGRVSLDSFYLDRSHLPVKRREALNFDHPQAIDWPLVEKVLGAIRAGQEIEIPQYDFETHCRGWKSSRWIPKEVVLVEGLWLLHRAGLRQLFDLSIFLECDVDLRLRRRLARDQAERGRSEDSVRRQFEKLVAPMHERYVAPQRVYAEWVLGKPLTEADVTEIAERIRLLIPEGGSATERSRARRAEEGLAGTARPSPRC